MATRVLAAQPKPALRAALESRLRGETKSSPRIIVSFIKCSTVLSDYGNLAGGYKALLDRLRDCQIIPDDDPKTIKEEYDQIKVGTIKEKGTLIRIEFQ